MADVHLELVDLSKSYGPTVAVDGVSLQIERGAFTCLLGPSGCGKTTTLRTIAGFVEPDSGDVRIGGKSQLGRSAHRRPTSIVFQDYALFPHMTVAENVAYCLKTAKRKPDEIRHVTEILEDGARPAESSLTRIWQLVRLSLARQPFFRYDSHSPM
jgi:ABC-type Fe3+/spermidine/putrescine transport system ATPase subunit